LSDLLWRDVVGAEVDALGSDSQGDVGAGVDEESGSQGPGARGQSTCFANCANGFAGQLFQLSCREIFFAELDVIHASAGGFGDLFEQAATAGEFVAEEGAAVGDVVEKAAGRHQLSQVVKQAVG
jgi:hypothetical protein